MNSRLRRFTWTSLATVAALVTVAVTLSSAQSPDGSSQPVLKELLAEVRGLRGTVERYADSNVRARAAADALSVQERRSAQAVARLDAIRKELDAVTATSRDTAAELELIESGVRSEDSLPGRTLEERRRNRTAMLRELNAQLRKLSQVEQQLRVRESELLDVVSTEELAWQRLVNQMTQLIKQ